MPPCFEEGTWNVCPLQSPGKYTWIWHLQNIVLACTSSLLQRSPNTRPAVSVGHVLRASACMCGQRVWQRSSTRRALAWPAEGALRGLCGMLFETAHWRGHSHTRTKGRETLLLWQCSPHFVRAQWRRKKVNSQQEASAERRRVGFWGVVWICSAWRARCHSFGKGAVEENSGKEGWQREERWWEGPGFKDMQNRETQGMGKAQGPVRKGTEEKDVQDGRRGQRRT